MSQVQEKPQQATTEHVPMAELHSPSGAPPPEYSPPAPQQSGVTAAGAAPVVGTGEVPAPAVQSPPPAVTAEPKGGATAQQPMNAGPYPPGTVLVTPITQMGEQTQLIDCPFCLKRTKIRVHKEGTAMQVVTGVLCCLLCVCLACVPCLAHWFENTEYYCATCNKKLAEETDDGHYSVFGPGGTVTRIR
ncbi:hypothetical protein QBC35DRAFT_221251 [Podospora australis]|uniref:LITAF domain-containing protein n=1 Tax=Podospora australis TaxID=1536484 RepID=A0AAN6WSV5_9PEZI|nr:hypothetical protein QBC35DRAFT_221251 [Podospora australis]